MGYTLVTGANGLIGRALLAALSGSRPVVALSRRAVDSALPTVVGDFTCATDLRRLDAYDIQAVVHLAAVTGGCYESDGLRVNVAGTRGLIRHLLDRGCRKFVLASSIAAVGLADPAFRPLEVPIPDEHPCLARDAYGLSKYLMEELARYFSRQCPDLDGLSLRLASVDDDRRLPQPQGIRPLGPWAPAGITVMALSDAVRAFTLALDAPRRPGARVLNAAPPLAWVAVPTARILREWYGASVDAAYFHQPGQEFASLFDVRRVRDELGFVADRLP